MAAPSSGHIIATWTVFKHYTTIQADMGQEAVVASYMISRYNRPLRPNRQTVPMGFVQNPFSQSNPGCICRHLVSVIFSFNQLNKHKYLNQQHEELSKGEPLEVKEAVMSVGWLNMHLSPT